MSCPKTKRISAYVDDEIGSDEKTVLESHMLDCTICSKALEELRSLRMAFSRAERHQAPLGFSVRVMAQTRELEKKKSPWFVPLLIGFAEAAVLLIVISIGITAGKIVTNSGPSAGAPSMASSLSLDVFAPTPPESLGGVYLAMTEVENEK